MQNKSKFCYNCGSLVPQYARFCKNCGTAFRKTLAVTSTDRPIARDWAHQPIAKARTLQENTVAHSSRILALYLFVGFVPLLSVMVLSYTYSLTVILMLISIIATLILWYVLSDKVVALLVWRKKRYIIDKRSAIPPVNWKLVAKNTFETGLFFFGLSAYVLRFIEPYTALVSLSGVLVVMVCLFPVSTFILPSNWILTQLGLLYKEGEEEQQLGVPALFRVFIGIGAGAGVLLFAYDLWIELGAYGLWQFIVLLVLFVLPQAYLSSAFFTLFGLSKQTKRAQLYKEGRFYQKSEIILAGFAFVLVLGVFSAIMASVLTPIGPSTLYSNQSFGFSFEYARYNGGSWHVLSQRDINDSSSKAVDKTIAHEFEMGLVQSGEYPRLIVVSVSKVPTANVTVEFLQARIAHEDNYIKSDPSLKKVSSRAILVNGLLGYEYKYQSKTLNLNPFQGEARSYTLCVLYGNQREYRIASEDALSTAKSFDQKFFQPIVVQSFTVFQTEPLDSKIQTQSVANGAS